MPRENTQHTIRLVVTKTHKRSLSDLCTLFIIEAFPQVIIRNMSQMSFDEEQAYRRTSSTAKKGSIIEPLRSFLVSSGVPATKVDYVLLGAVGALLLIATFIFLSAGSGVNSPRPPLEELQSMNARPAK